MKKKIFRIIAIFLAINIFFDAVYPTAAYALTGGPKQPEVSGFAPIGTSEMVNAFTGDFNYNIPLMDIGGYPLNLSYQAGVTSDQEASWVGLGWSLNPGVIDRNMRSLPDEFNGDEITKEFHIKPNTTFGIKFFPSVEVVGVKIPNKNLSFGLGLTYNNYTGFGFSASLDLKASFSESSKTPGTAKLGLSAGSEEGVGISPSLSFSGNVMDKQYKELNLSASVGLAYNSRAGLQSLSLSGSAGTTVKTGDGLTFASGGTSISFVSPTYMPSSGHSMINANLSLAVTLGAEIFPTHPNARLEGYFAGQYLMDQVETFPAYGYIHAQNATQDKALLDFNREKSGSFNEKTPSLPLTNFTYDLYNVSGQGIGGMYRAHRSDIGVLYDSKVINISGGADFPGLEVGAGNTAHPGINVSLNESNSISGKWEKNNDAAGILGFQGSTNDPFYEASYFKQAGESNAETDEKFFKDMGGFEPVRININHNPETVPAQSSYNEPGTNMHTTTRSARARRNEVISLLTATEANHYADIPLIESYQRNTFTVNDPVTKDPTNGYKNIFKPQETIVRNYDYRKGHHTSQITTYRDDGAKYVYGIPAYNLKQDERTFAVQFNENNPGEAAERIEKGVVNYVSGTDDTRKNKNGLDHYFEKTLLPGYAHSYLLTEILSADYVDVTGDGPTDDDLGTYTKINYTKTTANPYKWRVPYQEEKASFNEGLKSLKANEGGDDKGSYIYGEKELWYIHSIETKNYVAEFKLANRCDAFGVKGEEGGFSADSKSQKLSSITLYSKQELLQHKTNPVPLKTVHFEYDYSLCKNVDNNIFNFDHTTNVDVDGNFPNQGGKLTLKKVYFTYGDSKKGKLSPYEFVYADADHNGETPSDAPYNPNYNLKGYDRWGNYKENTVDHPTSEFPYTEQTTQSNVNAAAWLMTSVNLPSGGVINIDYESDDYAYVQNKRAMQMFKVIGISDGVPGAVSDGTNKLYKDLVNGGASRNYLIFDLPDQSVSVDNMERDFLREKDGTMIKNLYFRFLVDLGRLTMTSANRPWEYVSGYAEIDNNSCGTFNDQGRKYGWVKLKTVKILDKLRREPQDVNPISQAAWCFTKMNLPVLAYNKNSISENGLLQIVKAIATTLKSLSTVFNGFYNQMRLEHMAQNFDMNKSFIRLYNPSNSKKGGGVRVKKLALSDQWNSMTGNSNHETSEYGQVYDYTTTDNYGNKISSGVAAYEPILGGDENPFRQPVKYEIEHKWAASDQFYQEEPYGESFFPGPSVGYSMVTVKNLQYGNVKRHATGAVVNEFYTAKDFPTITKQTTTDVARVKPNPLLKLLKIRVRDFTTATQGFSVELNNMHGKPKGTYIFAEGKEKPISGVKYLYKTTVKTLSMPTYVNEPIQIGSLDNDMLVMERDGSIGTKMVGVDYDFVTDMREQETVSRTGGIGGNIETFFAGVIPAAIPTVYPSYSQEKTRFRAAVTTKIINRYGILEETVAYDQGSIVSTKNKMLDAETGAVLLTETKNQFDDPIYSFTYPAHIEYEGMGPAYKNIDLQLKVDDISNPKQYFVPGDELEVFEFGSGPIGSITWHPKVWVKTVSTTAFSAIDIDGAPVNLSGKYIRILRSGRRNQQGTPIGSFVSKVSPLQDSDGNGKPEKLIIDASRGILKADAVEFKEDWGLFCECGIKEGMPFNPYVLGTKGNWRMLKSYLQLTGRTQSTVNRNTNVREDGIYTGFQPFWEVPKTKTTDPWAKSMESWQATSEVTIYSPYGFELENKDALGIYSSAIYGYNNSLPTAVSANAKYKEIAFDGFEDYDFNSCKDDHFSYKSQTPTNDKLERKKSHTGKNSIKVGANSEIQLEKKLIKCL